MAKIKNTGLGKGLDAIFLDNSGESGDSVSVLRISEIEPNPDQPRRDFDPEALAQLASSIAAHGLIQPLVVRNAVNDGYYQIIAGERRWRAAKMAGLTEVPVIVMELDDRKAAQISLIENIQREDLNAVEEAAGYRSLMTEYAMTQEEVSRQIGKSRSAIANSMRLLDLPEEIIQMVRNGELTAGHARALLMLRDGDSMIPTARAAKSKGLSVRALEALVRSINRGPGREEPNGEKSSGAQPDYIAELARRMTSRLGKRVRICDSGKNKKIEIEYQGNDDLDDIIKLLCGDNIFDED